MAAWRLPGGRKDREQGDHAGGLPISRGFIAEQGVAFEPELALLEVVAHTHWLPRHWRGRGHTREVQEQFQQLFQFKVRPGRVISC